MRVRKLPIVILALCIIFLVYTRNQSILKIHSDSIHDISKNLISKESTNDSIQIENSNVLFFEKLNVTKEGKKDFEKQIVEPKKQSLKDPSNLETNVNGPYINKYVEISVKRPKIQDKGMLPSAANRFNTNNSQLSSDSWTPILFNECLSSFKNSAPCILKANPDSNILQAQELIYPAFKLKSPSFLNLAQKMIWVELAHDTSRMRLSNDLNYAEYPTFFGQNLVFQNVVFENNPPADRWSDFACMGSSAQHSQFIHPINENLNSSTGKDILDSIVIATSPDSWSFQHFLDRVTVVWSQALLSSFIYQKTAIVTGGDRRSEFVDKLFLEMGVKSHIHYSGAIYARELVFSCRAPLIHPYTTQRVSELFGLDMTIKNLKSRKVILYLSRNIGDVSNAGRKVLNEVEVLEALKRMVIRRNKSEEVVVFDRLKYTSVEHLVNYIGDNVSAMIGPHGSAFHNARFAQKDTLIVEFMPKARFQVCFWEQARLMEQKYITVMVDGNSNHDMIIKDIDGLIKLIDLELGVESEKKNRPVEATYPWKSDTLN